MLFVWDSWPGSIEMKKDDQFDEQGADRTVSNGYLSVAELRKLAGLRPLKPGFCRCLKCDGWFVSPDIVTVRRCDTCKQREEYEEIYLEDLEENELLDTTLLDKEDE